MTKLGQELIDCFESAFVLELFNETTHQCFVNLSTVLQIPNHAIYFIHQGESNSSLVVPSIW
jgi:hypothetical protein